MIVDDVEDDLQTGFVEARDHLLEFAQTVRDIRRVARVGREKADRVVAPVVRQPLFLKLAVVDERMDRQEFDRGHTERLDVIDDRFLAESGVGAPQALGNRRVQLRETLDVGLVENRVVPGYELPALLAVPLELLIDDNAFGHEWRAVAVVERRVVTRLHLVAEDGGIPFELAGMGARIGIEKQLVGIETMAFGRLVGSMHAVAVELSGPDVRHIAVEDLVRVFRQLDTRGLGRTAAVEQTDFNLRRVGRKQREVGALSVPMRTARMGCAFFYRVRHVVEILKARPPLERSRWKAQA